MTEPGRIDRVDIYLRRRASDRARERASRAAYLGDRAGLLIATAAAAALMSARAETILTASALTEALAEG